MTIPSYLVVLREVKNGSGGVNHDSIPVKEDIGAGAIGWLKNGSIVRIADHNVLISDSYRKTIGTSTWVQFECDDPKFSGDVWIEENSHLFPIVETPPAPVEEIVEVEVMEIRIQPGGQMFAKIRKVP